MEEQLNKKVNISSPFIPYFMSSMSQDLLKTGWIISIIKINIKLYIKQKIIFHMFFIVVVYLVIENSREGNTIKKTK